MKKILFNISDTPSREWEDKQREGWDEIIDYPLLNIYPHMSMGEVWEIALDTLWDVGERAWKIDVQLTHELPLYITYEGENPFNLALIEAIRLTGWFVIFAFPTYSRIVLPDGQRRNQFECWRFVRFCKGYVINPRSLVLQNGQRLEIYASCEDAFVGETEKGEVVVIFQDDPLFPRFANILFREFILLERLRDSEIFDPINWIPLVRVSEDRKHWRVVNRIRGTQKIFKKEKEARRYAYEQALREFYWYYIKQWR